MDASYKPTIHASAVLVGGKAVLVRGPSKSGKSSLVLALIEQAGGKLVGDDRVYVEARDGHLMVRPAPGLAGMIEKRGTGILRLDHAPTAEVALVVDLGGPEGGTGDAIIEDVTLPRLSVASGTEPLPAVLAALRGGMSGFR